MGLIIAALLASLALAGDGAPTGYVLDNAGLLDPATVAALDAQLSRYEVETSNQVVVETVTSLGGMPIEDYALRRATELGIGQKAKDNGVLVVVSRDDRKARIEVGYGLEGALPDVLCARIIRVEMVPRFREGSYADGVTAGVNAILAAIRGEYRASHLDRLYAVVPEFTFPRIDRTVQIVVGVFYWLFSTAWLFAGPTLFHVRGRPVRLGVVPLLALSGLLAYAFPYILVPLGFLAILYLQNRFFPERSRTWSSGGPGGRSYGGGGSYGASGGSSGGSSYSSSSSGSSFSGGGGSFGGGGASGSW